LAVHDDPQVAEPEHATPYDGDGDAEDNAVLVRRMLMSVMSTVSCLAPTGSGWARLSAHTHGKPDRPRREPRGAASEITRARSAHDLHTPPGPHPAMTKAADLMSQVSGLVSRVELRGLEPLTPTLPA